MTLEAPQSRLTVRDVSKSYGAVKALRRLDLTIDAGEIHAICGHNGAGKSTFVKILTGLVRADTGAFSIDGVEVDLHTPQLAQRAGVAIVDQELSLIDALSVSENIMLGLQGQPLLVRAGRTNSYVRDLLQRVGLGHIPPATLVGRLSLGEKQLVEIARALGRQAKLLILDEPTATLSRSEISFVFDSVRGVAQRGTSVIFVSHRLGEVLELCDRVTVFRDGGKIDTLPVKGTSKSAIIEMMLGEVLHVSQPGRYVDAEVDRPSVKIRGVDVPGSLEPTDLDIYTGQIVALAGQVGSGASDFLRALGGLEPGSNGRVLVGGVSVPLGSPIRSRRAGMLYVSNDRKSEGLFLDRNVADNLVATRLSKLVRAGLIRLGEMKLVGERLARSVGLPGRLQSAVGALSGGNQQKVFLGRCLEQGGYSLLLLDEPTRGVDVGGRNEIHEIVRTVAQSGDSAIFASTELDEVLELADTVVVFAGGRVVAAHSAGDVTAAELLAEMTHANLEGIPA